MGRWRDDLREGRQKRYMVYHGAVVEWDKHALRRRCGGGGAGPNTVDPNPSYHPKLGMVDAIKATNWQKSGYRAMTAKGVDINAARLGNVRAGNTKVVRAVQR